MIKCHLIEQRGREGERERGREGERKRGRQREGEREREIEIDERRKGDGRKEVREMGESHNITEFCCVLINLWKRSQLCDEPPQS